MILLRKLIEENLVKHELGFLHLSMVGGYLYLSGECGKHYVNIKGIDVNKKLSVDERAYIADLVNKWINTHVKEINRILELSSLLAVEFPEQEGIQLTAKNTLTVGNIHLDPDGDIRLYGTVNKETMIKFINRLDEYTALLEEHAKFLNIQRVYLEEIEALQSCTL